MQTTTVTCQSQIPLVQHDNVGGKGISQSSWISMSCRPLNDRGMICEFQGPIKRRTGRDGFDEFETLKTDIGTLRHTEKGRAVVPQLPSCSRIGPWSLVTGHWSVRRANLDQEKEIRALQRHLPQDPQPWISKYFRLSSSALVCVHVDGRRSRRRSCNPNQRGSKKRRMLVNNGTAVDGGRARVCLSETLCPSVPFPLLI